MAIIFRFLKITWVILRYRLDTFLPRQHLNIWAKLLLTPCLLFPILKLSRGERLRIALETLGPVFVKFGQLLSTRPDLIPNDIVTQLAFLQDKVAPIPQEEFRRIVESELGATIETLFDDYDSTPLASASIAQVHAAKLKNGKAVIIKAVRPNLEPVIENDVAIMLVIARLVERFSSDGKRLRPVEIVQDYRTTILDELDMQREAANASKLRRNFLQSDLLYVPEIYWEYTRRQVLVMERIYGVQVTDLTALNANKTNLKRLAERGVEIFFTQVFDHNFFHADMHPGNIYVNSIDPENPQYIALDMAIVGSLSPNDQYYLARNLLAMFRRDYRQIAELHIQSGWVPSYVRIDDFEAAIRTVCEPIFEKPLKDISFGLVLLNLFRTARRFDMQVQPQLVLLQKTLLNVEGLGRQLYPDLDLWATAHPFLEDWLKRRYHPKTVWKQLKHQAPEWLEKISQAPHLVFNGLQQVKKLNQLLPELEKAARSFRERSDSSKSTGTWAGISILLFSVGLLIAFANLGASGDVFPLFKQTVQQIPLLSWGCFLTATIIYFRR